MEEIKAIYQNIEKCLCLYLSGELTFNEAYDMAEPYFNKLCYIRYKEIIDNFIEYKYVVSEEETNGSIKN